MPFESSDLVARGLGASDVELGITPPPREWRVFIRNAATQIVGELSDWVKLKYINRTNAVGAWSLEVRLDNPSIAAGLLAKDGGIVIKRDGVTDFSGPVFTQYTRTATTLRVAGVCDNIVLAARQVLPTPAGPPYTEEYHTQHGTASSVMQSLVSLNAGIAARTSPVDRRVPGLLLPPDPLVGGVVFTRGRFGVSLLTLLAEVAVSEEAGGLQFRVIQADDAPATRYFVVAEARDRRDAARFGIDQQTASDVEDVYRAPGANYWFLGAGDALGADRGITEGSALSSIAETGLLLEAFVDERSKADPEELAQRLDELKHGAVSSRRVTVTPIEGGSTAYGTAWDLGDLVAAVVAGTTITKVIREIQVDLTPGRRAVVTPMLGDAGASNDADTAEGRMAQYIMAVDTRLGKIEGHFGIPDNSITPAMLTTTTRPPVGQVVSFAGSSAPPGWLLCQGQAVSRTTYAALFAAIGATYGGGDGSTTFTLPDARGRVLLGVSGSHALGTTGGAESVSGPAHTHPQSHSHEMPHTHGGQTHTHPQTHSHGIGSHTHNFAHGHSIDHDHGQFDSAYTNVDGVAVGHASLGSGSTDHKHEVNPPSFTGNSGDPFPDDVTGGGSGSTDPDDNVGAAQYTGSPSAASPASTDPDDNVGAANYGGATIATLPPFLSMHAIIYAGV